MTQSTAELIAQAEAALEGVTDGPWEWAACHCGLCGPDDTDVLRFTDYEGMSIDDGPDARFIAASRQLIPALIAALKRQDTALADIMARTASGEDDGFLREIHDIARAGRG